MLFRSMTEVDVPPCKPNEYCEKKKFGFMVDMNPQRALTNVSLFSSNISKKKDADDISKKYMQEGITVDIGIMFLASESLNLVIDSPDFRKRNGNTGIREEIYNEYRILIMGPNTFAAYLTSVNMGFKTLSVNEKVKEIVKDLGRAKKEFSKFNKSTQLLIKGAESLLNRAREQATRERAMSRVLENIDDSSNKE